MKRKLDIVGVIFLAVAVFLITGLFVLFPVCGPMDDGSFMKCHWTGRALIGSGIISAALAVVHLLINDAKAKGAVALAQTFLGIYNIALVTFIIGLCKMETMQCVAVTKPSVIVISIVLIAVGIFRAVRNLKSGKVSDEK